MLEQAAKHVSDDDEEIRRDGVTLTKPLSAVNPASRDAIQEHRGFSRIQQAENPSASLVRESTES
jgi:hypothetical protein